MLKKEIIIVNEKIFFFKSEFNTLTKLSTGKKPPEEITVKEKLKASKVLRSTSLKTTKIIKVKKEYNINTLNDCFKVSEVLKDKKSVNEFFKLLSKTSINKIIEKRKYNPPIHCEVDLHNIRLWSKFLTLSKIVNPVDVNPDIDSK